MNQTPELKAYNQDEKDFYRWVRTWLHRNEKRVHIVRLESTVGPGVPDLSVSIGGIEFWIELKIVLPHGVLLRKEQYAWMVKRDLCGGTCLCVAWCKEARVVMIWRVSRNLTVRPYGESKKYVMIDEPADWSYMKRDIPDLIKLIYE